MTNTTATIIIEEMTTAEKKAELTRLKAEKAEIEQQIKSLQSSAVENGDAYYDVVNTRSAPKIADYEKVFEVGHSKMTKLELRGVKKFYNIFAKTGTRKTFKWCTLTSKDSVAFPRVRNAWVR
jgi:hypothetical protein